MAKAKQRQPSRRAITRRRNMARSKRRETPLGRLSTDGASSPRNISRRLLWLAIEWRLEAPPKIGRSPSDALADYCRHHRISFDWMLTGCPADLKKMIDWRREREASVCSTERIGAIYAQLTPERQAIVTAEIQRILAERDR